MKEKINKIILFTKTHKKISISILIAILIIGYFGYNKITSGEETTEYITTKVEKGNISSTVSGSGQVSASNEIEIKAKASGDILYISKKNGDEITKGTLIAGIDAGEAQKSVRDAQINLESAKISFEKTKMENGEENISANSMKIYTDAFNLVADTFIDLPDVLDGIEEILNEDNLSENVARSTGKTAQEYRELAEKSYYEAEKSLKKIRSTYVLMNTNSSKEEVENIILETYETLKIFTDAVKDNINYVNFMADKSESNSGFESSKDSLSNYNDTINSNLTSILSSKTEISDDKNYLTNANLDIKSAELSLRQKENALQDALEELSDYSIRAPFDGTIASLEIEKGDLVSSSMTIATFITKDKIAEISLNEVDVANIKIGQKAELTFDALEDLTIPGIVTEKIGRAHV